MSRRKDKIDWAKAQKLYRLGQLSLREIARQVGVEPSSITRRADRENWERDAAEDVRKATEQLLLSNKKTTAPTRDDIVAAAQTNVTVVRGHRQFLNKMGTIAERLADWMILEIDKEDPAMPKVAEAFVKCAQAAARFIPLERQAFNIDKSGTGQQSLGEWLSSLDDQPSAPLPAPSDRLLTYSAHGETDSAGPPVGRALEDPTMKGGAKHSVDGSLKSQQSLDPPRAQNEHRTRNWRLM